MSSTNLIIHSNFIKSKSFFGGAVMKLKEIRLKKGLTQKEVGDIIGLKRNTVSALENGKSVMNHIQIIKFCEAFNVKSDDLLDLK